MSRPESKYLLGLTEAEHVVLVQAVVQCAAQLPIVPSLAALDALRVRLMALKSIRTMELKSRVPVETVPA